MVNLTRIYTRTGDAGSTRLSDLSEARKTDLRVEAYGQVDEANAILGLVTTQEDLPEDIRTVLRHIQNELFDAGADLSHPLRPNPAYEPLRIIGEYVERLEGWCDHYGEQLPPLRSFILPGGSKTSAWLQLARAVVRRAERAAWAAAEAYGTQERDDPAPGGVNPVAIAYLNRLSDLLFILARVTGQAAGEVMWIPGKDRQVTDPRGRRQRERITGSALPEEPTPAS